jgi:hypothetical protein
MMISSEAKLIDALKRVEQFGDVSSGRADDPSTMILRQVAIRDDLIRWDHEAGAYYLTTSGFARLRRVSRPSATIMRLPTERKRARRVS